MSVAAPSRTGRVGRGRDVRFEEGGREPREGACWVCSRSCLPHPTHACRSCRAGKPGDWTAPKPEAAPVIVPILTAAEKRTVSLRSVIEGTAARGKARKESFVTARIKQACPCGFTSDWPPAFGKHRAFCEVALGGKPKPVQAPRGGGPRAEAKPAPEPAPPEVAEEPDDPSADAALSAVVDLLEKVEPLDRAARVVELQAVALRKIADAAHAFGQLSTASRAAVLERLG